MAKIVKKFKEGETIPQGATFLKSEKEFVGIVWEDEEDHHPLQNPSYSDVYQDVFFYEVEIEAI